MSRETLSVTACAVPAPPKGELANAVSLRGFSPLKAYAGFPRSAALSQKAALQLPLAVATPPVKKGFRKVRRLS